MLTPWKKRYDKPRQHIKKQRHYFADKGLSSQGMVPLDCKAVQPVHPKGDQSWVFFGRTDAKAETQYFGHLI